MAILHAWLVNLTYGVESPLPLLEFFEGRSRDHGSVFDAEGLELYALAAETLASPEGTVLSTNFAGHYHDARKLFALVENQFERFAPGVITRLRDSQEDLVHEATRADRRGALIVPFVYMGDHFGTRFQTVLLENVHTRSYRRIDASDLPRRRRVAIAQQRLSAAIAKLATGFDSIVAMWKEKTALAGKPTFWAEVNRQVSAETGIITLSHRTASSTKPAINDGPISLPPDFDPHGYLRINPDVMQAGVDPIAHFVSIGHREGRSWR